MGIKQQSKWLFKCEDVQEDLKILQVKYKELGYDFSIEDCYNIWYLYSEMLCANWINVDGDISQSVSYVINNKNCWEN